MHHNRLWYYVPKSKGPEVTKDGASHHHGIVITCILHRTMPFLPNLCCHFMRIQLYCQVFFKLSTMDMPQEKDGFLNAVISLHIDRCGQAGFWKKCTIDIRRLLWFNMLNNISKTLTELCLFRSVSESRRVVRAGAFDPDDLVPELAL